MRILEQRGYTYTRSTGLERCPSSEIGPDFVEPGTLKGQGPPSEIKNTKI